MLLKSLEEIPLYTDVSLVMSAQGTLRPVRVLATGKIVRVEKHGPEPTFALAVQFQQPISAIDIVAGSVVLRPRYGSVASRTS
jgi:hypothetical protein